MLNMIHLKSTSLLIGLALLNSVTTWDLPNAAELHDKFENVWEAFKTRFAKKYENMNDEEARRQVFMRKLQVIQSHNIEARLGLHSFTLDLNEFADWTKDEYRNYLTGYRAPSHLTRNDGNSDASVEESFNGNAGDISPDEEAIDKDEQLNNELRRYLKGKYLEKRSIFSHHNYQPAISEGDASLPAQVDWRDKGWVTPVKNQGKCGSCWSFSTTGALEAQHCNKTGQLVSLSEQNLVDCSKANHGCNGGVPDYAFRYVQINGGVDTEESYPYTGQDGQCRFSKSNIGGTCSGWTDLTAGDEMALQKAVATIGPVSVAIDASSILFQLYRGGVYKTPFCSSTNLDHAVLVVGYGNHNGTPYWLVKNSWGTSWGADGYVMIARNEGNMCGIATQASVPYY